MRRPVFWELARVLGAAGLARGWGGVGLAGHCVRMRSSGGVGFGR